MTLLLSNLGSRPDHCVMEGANPRRGEDLPHLDLSLSSNTLVTPLATWCRSVLRTSKSPSTGVTGNTRSPGSFFWRHGKTLPRVGLDFQTAEEMAPGQPFYLNLISLSGSWWRCRCNLSHKYCHRGPFGGHHPHMDVTWHMANKRRAQRRIPTVGRSSHTNGPGQLSFGQGLLIPGQTDLCGRGGHGYG